MVHYKCFIIIIIIIIIIKHSYRAFLDEIESCVMSVKKIKESSHTSKFKIILCDSTYIYQAMCRFQEFSMGGMGIQFSRRKVAAHRCPHTVRNSCLCNNKRGHEPGVRTFFQLMERHRSWDSFLISIYQIDTHDLKNGNVHAR